MKEGKHRGVCLIVLMVLVAVLRQPGVCTGEVVDRIVAIVNDDVITLSELNEGVAPFLRQVDAVKYTAEQRRQMLFKIREDMLNSMIDQKLTQQESERLGVSVDPEEVDRQIESIKAANAYTEEALKQALKAEGFTLEAYRDRLKEQLLTMRLINREVKSKIAITEQDVRQYYEDHQAEFAGEKKYHLRTILIRVPSWQDLQAKKKALMRMDSVLEALKAGTPFDDVARQYSEDVTARDGGDLGLFKINELAPEVQETVRWMKQGDVSPVLETSQGYQILMLEEIRSATGKTLDQARIEIQERLYRDRVEKKYRAWLDALRKRSYIKIVR